MHYNLNFGFWPGLDAFWPSVQWQGVRKIWSGKLHHFPYFFSFKFVYFGYNFMKQNFVYFLKNVTDKETGQAPH
jgi:hypothetical protein